MLDKVLIGFVGAALALLIRELVAHLKRSVRRRRIAALCSEHLKMIRSDLSNHVKVSGGRAHFEETQYCEVSVGDFLYHLITNDIECFGGVQSLKDTVTFFHHYMVNMATVKARLGRENQGHAQLTEATYHNLLKRLDASITELDGLATS